MGSSGILARALAYPFPLGHNQQRHLEEALEASPVEEEGGENGLMN